VTAFAGRVGLVTGSASGIGRATALLLAQRGARVVAADIDGKRVTETVEAIRESGGEGEWEEVLAVNLTGAFLVTRAALRALRVQGGGAIVHVASRAAIRAKARHGAYSAAKAGILQLTQMAALEGAPHRIRVNCVCPGFVDTPMTRGGYGDSAFAAWSEVCPLGRPGTPEDVAKAMLFLASDEAAFITGVALPVDGGRAIV